jgi:hypothetical protein
MRGKKNIPVKAVVDEALTFGCDSIETVLVTKIPEVRLNGTIRWINGGMMK